jgi:hypothetical protein
MDVVFGDLFVWSRDPSGAVGMMRLCEGDENVTPGGESTDAATSSTHRGGSRNEFVDVCTPGPRQAISRMAHCVQTDDLFGSGEGQRVTC